MQHVSLTIRVRSFQMRAGRATISGVWREHDENGDSEVSRRNRIADGGVGVGNCPGTVAFKGLRHDAGPAFGKLRRGLAWADSIENGRVSLEGQGVRL